MTASPDRAGNRHAPNALRQDIERTRRRISAEIHALETKLSVDYLRKQTREKTRRLGEKAVEGMIAMTLHVGEQARQVTIDAGQKAQRFGTIAIEAVRRNPVPTALIVLGTGAILYRAMEPQLPAVQRARERAHQKMSEIGSSVHQQKEKARERALDGGAAVRERASNAAHRSSEQAHRAATTARSLYESHPFLVLSTTLLAGAGLAMLLPSTRREDRTLGTARDQAFTKLRERGNEARQVASTSLREGMDAARSAAHREASHRHDGG